MEEPDGLVAWAAANVPEAMRDDPIWRLAAYRYALYLADLVQQDVPKIRANPKTRSLTDQLVDADASISANIALDPEVVTARIALATRIMRILTIAIKRERAQRETRARRLAQKTERPE